jgi:hypothetical protein
MHPSSVQISTSCYHGWIAVRSPGLETALYTEVIRIIALDINCTYHDSFISWIIALDINCPYNDSFYQLCSMHKSNSHTEFH